MTGLRSSTSSSPLHLPVACPHLPYAILLAAYPSPAGGSSSAPAPAAPSPSSPPSAPPHRCLLFLPASASSPPRVPPFLPLRTSGLRAAPGSGGAGAPAPRPPAASPPAPSRRPPLRGRPPPPRRLPRRGARCASSPPRPTHLLAGLLLAAPRHGRRAFSLPRLAPPSTGLPAMAVGLLPERPARHLPDPANSSSSSAPPAPRFGSAPRQPDPDHGRRRTPSQSPLPSAALLIRGDGLAQHTCLPEFCSSIRLLYTYCACSIEAMFTVIRI
ncbi:hypothetical protein U9M48_018690 [Paspalum notatum var. saurae]|uniref:Uncharacterized protein n=1 Tax=Paspalum notatum var. saurae TaxID=547442 RepID=A0AAQ3TC11_PASNO